jgi:hypothetical protein
MFESWCQLVGLPACRVEMWTVDVPADSAEQPWQAAQILRSGKEIRSSIWIAAPSSQFASYVRCYGHVSWSQKQVSATVPNLLLAAILIVCMQLSCSFSGTVCKCTGAASLPCSVVLTQHRWQQ